MPEVRQTVPEIERTRGGRRTRGEQRQGAPGRPLVTVVLPVLNGGAKFVEALDSVLAQTYENVETIVVDGGSTDGTLDVLRARDSRIDFWTSGKDGGVYHAMNRGVELAAGDLIAILNADDGYMPDALERAVGALQAAGASFTFGTVAIRDESGNQLFTAGPLARPEAEGAAPSGRMPFPHISMVVARELYESIGTYDTHFRIAADYDFALRLVRSNAVGVAVPGTMGWVTTGGMSDSIRNLKEKRAILKGAGVSDSHATLIFASSVAKRWVSRLLPHAALKRLLRWLGTRVQ
ncbi:MAG: glycosyltransferase family 2 protein [Longimicrobiales bacterium]